MSLIFRRSIQQVSPNQYPVFKWTNHPKLYNRPSGFRRENITHFCWYLVVKRPGPPPPKRESPNRSGSVRAFYGGPTLSPASSGLVPEDWRGSKVCRRKGNCSQLFSDPGKKGNPFWGRPFLVGQPQEKRGKRGAILVQGSLHEKHLNIAL